MATTDTKKLLDAIRKARDSERSRMTFDDYLKEVLEGRIRPQTSHQLMAKALGRGLGESAESGERVWTILEGRLFGFTLAMWRIAQYFQHPNMANRILLLAGPVSSGKSSLVRLLKEELAAYTTTEKGAVWAISGCPIREEPLKLVPESVRGAIQEAFRASHPDEHLQFEGDLCPYCAAMVERVTDIAEVGVERIVLSEGTGCGVTAGFDMATQNGAPTTVLTGRRRPDDAANGVEGAGGVVLDGLLNMANRGVADIENVFSGPDNLLRELVSVADRREVRIQGAGSIDTDTLIIAQATYQEYQEAMRGEMAEEVREGFYMVKTPFPFRMAEEMQVYSTMLGRQLRLTDVHHAPNMFRAVAMLGLVTRVERVKTNESVPVLDKVIAYSGEPVADLDREALTRERDACPDEGLYGLSSRYIMNRLESLAMDPSIRCISPLSALRYISENASEVELKKLGVAGAELRVRLQAIVEDVMERMRTDLRKAHSDGFEQVAENTRRFYLKHARIAVRQLEDETFEVPGDTEYFLREMEERIEVSDRDRAEVRREIVEAFRGEQWGEDDVGQKSDLESEYIGRYLLEPRLRDMIEAKLLSPIDRVKGELKGGDKNKGDMDWRMKRNAVHERLLKYKYCHVCAVDLVELVVTGSEHPLGTRQGVELNWQWQMSQDPADLLSEFRGSSERRVRGGRN